MFMASTSPAYMIDEERIIGLIMTTWDDDRPIYLPCPSAMVTTLGIGYVIFFLYLISYILIIDGYHQENHKQALHAHPHTLKD